MFEELKFPTGLSKDGEQGKLIGIESYFTDLEL